MRPKESKLKDIVAWAINKEKFESIKGYIEFSKIYLEYISKHLQAVIVSRNEEHYNFYQYDKTGNYQITRPINSSLMYSAGNFNLAQKEYLKILKNIKDIKKDDTKSRVTINNVTYTIQQCIGAALDGINGNPNQIRKLVGESFERYIRLLLQELNINATSGTVKIPIPYKESSDKYSMTYQHDLIVKNGEALKMLGSIKTTSKDRLGKIFLDKFLYTRLTKTEIPHVAIFLNDIQRKKSKKENEYGISGTFLPGHFISYTLELNPLDGVYYCDLRPQMKTQPILKNHIKTFDHFICEDVWDFLKK